MASRYVDRVPEPARELGARRLSGVPAAVTARADRESVASHDSARPMAEAGRPQQVAGPVPRC